MPAPEPTSTKNSNSYGFFTSPSTWPPQRPLMVTSTDTSAVFTPAGSVSQGEVAGGDIDGVSTTLPCAPSSTTSPSYAPRVTISPPRSTGWPPISSSVQVGAA